MKILFTAVLVFSIVSTPSCFKKTTENSQVNIYRPAPTLCDNFRSVLKEIDESPESVLRQPRSEHMKTLHGKLSAVFKKNNISSNRKEPYLNMYPLLRCMPEVSFPAREVVKLDTIKKVRVHSSEEKGLILFSGATILGGMAATGIAVQTLTPSVFLIAPTMTAVGGVGIVAAATMIVTGMVVEHVETKGAQKVADAMSDAAAWKLIRLAADFKSHQKEIEALKTVD